MLAPRSSLDCPTSRQPVHLSHHPVACALDATRSLSRGNRGNFQSTTRLGVLALRLLKGWRSRSCTDTRHHPTVIAAFALVSYAGVASAQRTSPMPSAATASTPADDDGRGRREPGDQSACGTQHEAEQDRLAGSVDDVPPWRRTDLHGAARGRRQADSHSRAASGARHRSQDEHSRRSPAGSRSRTTTITSLATPAVGRCAWPLDGKRRRSSTAPRKSTREVACSKSKAGWPSRRRSGCDRSAVRRTYQAVGGHALPVRVESVADVKLAGRASSRCGSITSRSTALRVDHVATRPSLSGSEGPRLLIALN